MPRNSVKSAVQDFSKVVHADIPRSTFRRPSTLVTTLDAGKLVPIYIDEILPGDTFKMSLQHVARLITPLVPVMDNIKLEFFAFFVPNRIVWSNWQKLQGENTTSAWAPSTPPAGVPFYKTSPGAGVKVEQFKLGDYYGLPVGMLADHHGVNELPFRGYRKIWNDWFRNQNIQAPLTENVSDNAGLNTTNINMDLLKVNKPHDYFVSCLPAPQKGESQLIPIELNDLIPVITASEDAMTGSQVYLKLREGTGGGIPDPGHLITSGGHMVNNEDEVGTGVMQLYPSNLWADAKGLQINGTTISDLRTAFQIQRLYERDARGGTRYVEMLKAHFGVDAGDYRLQRPEFLGHVSSYVNINQVEQTSQTGTTPQGNLAAYGHSQGDDFLFNKSFVEHGFVHIFAVVRHNKTYQQGLERFWSRQDRLDYYLPVLAHISEQPVYTKEIYALENNENDVFGYQEAWSDYRYKPNRVTGQMRADATPTFEIWHFADEYSAAPTLVDAWMQDNSYTNIQRVLAVQTGNQIKLNVRFDLEATRPIPVNSIPGLIDHF